ncbi:dystroglycan-like [Anneissia japonica]|uniref:dystroglycan-like n=1 Tax=Anneissia japonica TaxID=1529436 RepID=UPI001425873D|nr:dystroglycan-like [Anneissia japonica]XP_033114590.1 dystroglycan-like [Anneissia japonica]XP_033114591.1 dystroglycan-like [Anneissia japonica]XP_033114592.1 dystroglycan-like [Anneissia japonica]
MMLSGLLERPILGKLTLFCTLAVCFLMQKTLAANMFMSTNSLDNATPVSMLWGVPDTSAVVGRIFKFAIPTYAFRGDVLRYELSEGDSDSRLPMWLHFNSTTNTLEGVPSEEDVGVHYISIIAIGKKSRDKDIFTIDVVPAPDVASSEAKDINTGVVKCQLDEPAVLAGIVLDAELSKMSPAARVSAIQKMSQYSMLAEETFTLLPSKTGDLSAIIAGPGNIRKPFYKGMVVSWQIGCGSRDFSKLPLVTVLESAAKDGTMAEKLGHNIISWHVKYDQPKLASRVRRQAIPIVVGTPLATPVPGSILPSVRPSSSIKLDMTPKPPTRSVPAESTIVMMSSSAKMSPSPTMKHPVKTQLPVPGFTAMPTPTPTPPRGVETSVQLQPTPVPTSETQAPTRTFSPPAQSMTPTEVLTSVPVMTTTPSSTKVPKATSSMIEPTSTSTTVVTTPVIILPPSTPPPPPTKKPKPTKKPVEPTKPVKETTPTMPTTTTQRSTTVDKPPVVIKDISRIEVQVGKYFDYKIPNDLFHDEDGDTSKLELALYFASNREPVTKDHWFYFDKKNQKLSGRTLIAQEVTDYLLVAQDTKGQFNEVVFEIVVKPAPKPEAAPVSMGMTLDIDYDEFMKNKELQELILTKLAAVFGDTNADNIAILSIERGSVILSWTNSSIPTGSCQKELIESLIRMMLNPDGTVTDEMRNAFSPDFTITEVQAMPSGVCLTTIAPTTTDTTTRIDGVPQPQSDDIWISTVLPAVVVAFILLIAGVIIFILYRKNRKGKLSDEDKHTFISKRIPIILPDEIQDAEKPPSSTSPLILKNEKPPLPPPDYAADKTSEPLLNEYVDLDRNSVPMVDLSGSPPYEPPPPLNSTPSENRTTRPINTPTHRAPPPYVPP